MMLLPSFPDLHKKVQLKVNTFNLFKGWFKKGAVQRATHVGRKGQQKTSYSTAFVSFDVFHCVLCHCFTDCYFTIMAAVTNITDFQHAWVKYNKLQ